MANHLLHSWSGRSTFQVCHVKTPGRARDLNHGYVMIPCRLVHWNHHPQPFAVFDATAETRVTRGFVFNPGWWKTPTMASTCFDKLSVRQKKRWFPSSKQLLILRDPKALLLMGDLMIKTTPSFATNRWWSFLWHDFWTVSMNQRLRLHGILLHGRIIPGSFDRPNINA